MIRLTDWVRPRGSMATEIERGRRGWRRHEPHPLTVATLEDAVRTALHMAGVAQGHERPFTPGPRVIGVTGPGGNEGKTMLSAAISGTLARHEGRGVVLVDTDPRTNAVADTYGLAGHLGLADFFAGETSLEGATCPSRARHLSIIPAGTQAMPPVSTAQMSALLEALRETHDYVVFDLPAVLRSTTAPPFARLCDGVMVVARSGSTTTQDLERTVRRLGDARVLGVVVNRWRTRIPRFVERALDLGM